MCVHEHFYIRVYVHRYVYTCRTVNIHMCLCEWMGLCASKCVCIRGEHKEPSNLGFGWDPSAWAVGETQIKKGGLKWGRDMLDHELQQDSDGRI